MEDVKRDRFDYYLDLETGVTVQISEGAMRDSVSSIYSSEPDEDSEGDVLVDSEIDTDAELPDEVFDILESDMSVILDGERFVRIPERESREAFTCMRTFSESLVEGPFKASLLNALNGRNSFRKYKQLLATNPREWKRWHSFNAKKMRIVIRSWIEDLGFRPVRERKV